eukprot:1095151-Prymnesium_polylepis.1
MSAHAQDRPAFERVWGLTLRGTRGIRGDASGQASKVGVRVKGVGGAGPPGWPRVREGLGGALRFAVRLWGCGVALGWLPLRVTSPCCLPPGRRTHCRSRSRSPVPRRCCGEAWLG